MNPSKKKGHHHHKPQYEHPPTFKMPAPQEATPTYIPKPTAKKTEEQVIRDALVLPIYNNQFKPVFYGNEGASEYFCDVLLPPPTLRQIANKNLLGKDNYLLIGMGVNEGKDPNGIMSFRVGLQKLYDKKIFKMTYELHKTEQLPEVKRKKDETNGYVYMKAERTNLEGYMGKYFGSGIAEIVPVYMQKNSRISPPKAGQQLLPAQAKMLNMETFRKKMAGMINSRLMMAYSVQELMPSNYNPMARMFFYEKLLMNAGTDYIAYYPALFDEQLSFGPFQFTPIAVKDLDMNFTGKKAYGCPDIPPNLEQKWTIRDHTNAAIAFALKNMDRLSVTLSKNPNAMKRVLEMIDGLSRTPEGNEKLQMFAIGLIGAMHFKPKLTEDALIRFASEPEKQWKADSKDPHTAILPFLPTKPDDVRRYYYNSAAVFLALPTYLQQVRKYHTQDMAKAEALPTGRN